VRSFSRWNRLLVLSRPSVSPNESAWHNWTALLEFLYWRSFMNICRENPIFLSRSEISGTLHEDLFPFYCYRRHWIAIRGLFSSEVVSGCWDSQEGINITRTRRTVVFWVYLKLIFCDLIECSLQQCFSAFVRPRPSKFFFHKSRARSEQIYSSVPFQFFFKFIH